MLRSSVICLVDTTVVLMTAGLLVSAGIETYRFSNKIYRNAIIPTSLYLSEGHNVYLRDNLNEVIESCVYDGPVVRSKN